MKVKCPRTSKTFKVSPRECMCYLSVPSLFGCVASLVDSQTGTEGLKHVKVCIYIRNVWVWLRKRHSKRTWRLPTHYFRIVNLRLQTTVRKLTYAPFTGRLLPINFLVKDQSNVKASNPKYGQRWGRSLDYSLCQLPIVLLKRWMRNSPHILYWP